MLDRLMRVRTQVALACATLVLVAIPVLLADAHCDAAVRRNPGADCSLYGFVPIFAAFIAVVTICACAVVIATRWLGDSGKVLRTITLAILAPALLYSAYWAIDTVVFVVRS